MGKVPNNLLYPACYHKLTNHNATKTHFRFILLFYFILPTDADSEVQDPVLASMSHPEPQIHEPSCSTESAEEIVEPPQLLPPATEESEQLSATPVLHVRFQEDLISEVSSSSAVCE